MTDKSPDERVAECERAITNLTRRLQALEARSPGQIIEFGSSRIDYRPFVEHPERYGSDPHNWLRSAYDCTDEED